MEANTYVHRKTGSNTTLHGVRITSCTLTDSNPHMDSASNMTHWEVGLASDTGSMSLVFSMGAALCREPTLRDVLSCLRADAGSLECADTFEEWAAEMGLDEDSRRAERTYDAVLEQSLQTRAIVSDWCAFLDDEGLD